MSPASSRLLVAASALSVLACGVSRVTPDTQGTTVTAGPCGRGLVVVESDYQSTNVSLLGFSGTVLSPSLASSSVESGGFDLGLSGDVVPPGSAVTGPDVVLIDRTPVGILRFVDLASASVSSELPVGTGFSANPHDYLALAEHKAYVARYESNFNPGQQMWDQGGDVLLVDPSLTTITGRIDLTPAMAGEAAQFTPHPARLALVAGRVFALLASYASDYLSATTSRLVELDPSTDSIVSTLLLDGLEGCDQFAVSPDGKELAVACTGADTLSDNPSNATSGLALVDITGTPQLTQHFSAAMFGSNPIGFAIDYVALGTLLFGTLGHFDESMAVAALDSLIQLDTASGAFQQILQSQSQPFTLGDVRCAPECGACFLADAERSGGSVLRFAIGASGTLGAPNAIRAETQIGLPPRYLGVF
ncbi:MAG TPA: hypothetical protein VK745_08090 [Polyangiaceae bacterium]|jgi:hypothetical protein|nr:hypothetical protein [Polyangiaceae bacterium]